MRNFHSRSLRSRRSPIVAAGVLLAAFLTGYGISAVNSGSTSQAATRQKQDTTQVNRDVAGDYVNFNLPYSSSKRLTDLAQAHSLVAFAPVAPASLGRPLGVYTAADLHDRATKTIAIVYQHPQYGRFMIIEGPRVGTQSDLETLVAECNGPHPCDADWHLSTMADGTVAAMHVGTSTAHATTGLMWLHGNTAYDLEGPASSFSGATALAVGNLIESTARSS